MLLIQADARALPVPDGYVQCVVTSPPYWGLRDYGTVAQVWGGVEGCEHVWGEPLRAHHPGQVPDSKWPKNPDLQKGQTQATGSCCQTCGAWKGHLGNEPTPEQYVANLVEVFREVRRVLREDGTVWLNLGDSYARAGGTDRKPSTTAQAGNTKRSIEIAGDRTETLPPGLKPKDLVGIPWRVAFALQADGWYLRSDIIWAKPNPMPESVTDRPTRSHEYVFLLTKRATYYYDAEAVKEASTGQGGAAANFARATKRALVPGQAVTDHRLDRKPTFDTGGRNRRSVWMITPKPYRGAHFATFPPQLVEPCVKAGSPEGGSCAACGTPLKRVIEKGPERREQQIACGGDAEGDYDGVAQKDYETAGAQDPSAVKARILAGMVERRTVGWTRTCGCDPAGEVAQAVVLDPFCGSGTVGMVCAREGRFFIGCDLKAEYLAMARDRILGRERACAG